MSKHIFLPVLVLALGAGCSHKYHREHVRAEKQIEAAEEAQSSEGAVSHAKSTVDEARSSEKLAEKDLDEGEKTLVQARERLERSEASLQMKSQRRDAIRGELLAAENRFAQQEMRESTLQAKGLTDSEARSVTAADKAVARQRVEGLKTTQETLDRQIELAKLERQAAESDIKAAQDRIQSAEQRLRVARVLYQDAEQQARTAEIEALSGKKAALDARLQSTGGRGGNVDE